MRYTPNRSIIERWIFEHTDKTKAQIKEMPIAQIRWFWHQYQPKKITNQNRRQHAKECRDNYIVLH